MRSLAAGLPLLVVALGALPACDHDTEERHLSEMADEIDHLQVDRDEATRAALGTEVADTHFSAVPQRAPAPSSAPPAVLRVGDDGAPLDSPDTEDPSPRPTIRMQGSPRRGEAASSLVDDGTVPATDPAGSAPSPGPSSALDPQAKRDYEAALSLVHGRQYDRALEALAAFLVKYPDHPYADNALFWRGECYFARGDWLHAAEQYEGVFTRFPAGNKAPDALLKLGMAQQKLGNPVKAREYYDRLAQSYPQSDAAHRIPPVTVPATTPPGPAPEDHR
jgi:tol-pal system protein YbgF